ncbi:MBL fold metallo-hydrolase [Shewanella abyssi]|uniref:MBL fold metallo-hydrolase n=1 Tax=Shewanella abyssi TaxID=311789 RepID=UPI00200D4FB3|nr:MBL fold metallo-hydrolase [Shewanella abyssi]MCL1051965.1 MBL fold metallo-hydrolase [Shewanella abyssi]
MKLIKLISILVFIGGIMLATSALTSPSHQGDVNVSEQRAHHKTKGGFINTSPSFSDDTAILPLLKRYITETRIDATPTMEIPVVTVTAELLRNLPESQDTVIRLGHSSIFLQVDGQRWLIDPVFSERASPFSFAGPKRFHQPPIALTDLPSIDGVMISHDHYDHLDKASIMHLAKSVAHFVVPLGVDKHLTDWGVKPSKIHSLDWWQAHNSSGVTITATPTQHFSGRSLFDKNDTLWASYVIQSANSSLYFSGDSGYFDGFKQIGDRFGPFDLTMVETGAYDKDWATIHMTPEQSLQAHIDLQGKKMMPIHNGTFDLAFHSWYDPLNQITQLASDANVEIVTPKMGELVSINEIHKTTHWWAAIAN